VSTAAPCARIYQKLLTMLCLLSVTVLRMYAALPHTYKYTLTCRAVAGLNESMSHWHIEQRVVRIVCIYVQTASCVECVYTYKRRAVSEFAGLSEAMSHWHTEESVV